MDCVLVEAGTTEKVVTAWYNVVLRPVLRTVVKFREVFSTDPFYITILD